MAATSLYYFYIRIVNVALKSEYFIVAGTDIQGQQVDRYEQKKLKFGYVSQQRKL